MKHLFIIIITMLIATNAMGQGKKPSWLNGYHRDLANSYIDVFSATGTSEDAARTQAIERIVDERSRATGRRYSVKETDGNITLTSNDELTVKCRIIDEYHSYQSYGGYQVSLLVQTAKHPEYPFEDVTVTDNYGATPVVMSIIPGLGQWYKGSKVKGICMFAAEAAAVAGILICANKANDAEKKIKLEPKYAKHYEDKKSNWETGRNICIGAAAAIWIYNMIDAAVAKGARRVEVKPAGRSYVSLAPALDKDYAGLALTYNF